MWRRPLCRVIVQRLANTSSRSRSCWRFCALMRYEDWTFRNSYRLRVGGCRVRFRAQSHLCASATACSQHHPCQTWEKDLDHPWGSCLDARRLSAQKALPPLARRNRLLRCQTQIIESCSWPLLAHATPTSPAVGPYLQSLSPVARLRTASGCQQSHRIS